MTIRDFTSVARRGRIAAAFVALALGAPAMAADAFSTDWAKSAKSNARLVAAGPALAGFEIRLARGAITYWRDPGDAGVPPTFDVSKSENVARIEATFPAPGASPSRTGARPSATIPASRSRSGSKPPTRPSPSRSRSRRTTPFAKSCACPRARRFRSPCLAARPPTRVRSRRRSPRRPEDRAGRLRRPDRRRRLRMASVRDREAGPARDLFVEPPAGWWVAVTPGAPDPARDCFAMTVREKPADAALPVSLRLTMTGGNGPVETTALAR